MHVTFPSAQLQLEGELSAAAAGSRGAVVCHPHPQYGGDMDNPVVCAVAETLSHLGYATLRFNFRGVGASTGTYGGGVGETDDVRAAAGFLIARTGVEHLTLAGYSFGAIMILQVAATLPAVDQLIAVAPPLAFFRLDCIAQCPKRKLFIVGDADQYCSVAQLAQQLAGVVEPKTQRVIAGADHFFAGRERDVTQTVREFAIH